MRAGPYERAALLLASRAARELQEMMQRTWDLDPASELEKVAESVRDFMVETQFFVGETV